MTAKATELCTSIVDYLNSSSFPYTFTAVRKSAVGIIRLDDGYDKQVFVYPSATGYSAETRGEWQRTVGATVHIIQVMSSPESLTESDECLELMELIEVALRDTYLGGMSMMAFESDQSTRDVSDADSALSRTTFEAVSTVTYFSHA